jgi:hypothetical protein
MEEDSLMITISNEPAFRFMKAATMAPPTRTQSYGAEEGECCPSCRHAWTFDGPAHYSDCRYFSLDDERDEGPWAPPSGARPE